MHWHGFIFLCIVERNLQPLSTAPPSYYAVIKTWVCIIASNTVWSADELSILYMCSNRPCLPPGLSLTGLWRKKPQRYLWSYFCHFTPTVKGNGQTYSISIFVTWIMLMLNTSSQFLICVKLCKRAQSMKMHPNLNILLLSEFRTKPCITYSMGIVKILCLFKITTISSDNNCCFWPLQQEWPIPATIKNRDEYVVPQIVCSSL